MRVGEARRKAADWVQQHPGEKPWFKVAYITGSTASLHEWEELPEFSDIDVMVASDDKTERPKLGKFYYKGVLLEITYLPWHLFKTAETILSSYHLAHGFKTDTIIADPTGHLRRLQRTVSAKFTERGEVRKRCSNAMDRITSGLICADSEASWPDAVTSWLFSCTRDSHCGSSESDGKASLPCSAKSTSNLSS
ncbi:hypothetical protein ACQCVE_11825 [Metabacillus sp. 113a]|uniref:hypothetical protein n=1 Tax=Metabacillus sp. 113a TaxID=3404706 RepID=UPI003CE82F31